MLINWPAVLSPLQIVTNVLKLPPMYVADAQLATLTLQKKLVAKQQWMIVVIVQKLIDLFVQNVTLDF